MVGGPSTGRGQLVDGRVLHYQRNMNYEWLGRSNWMKMGVEQVDPSRDFVRLAPGDFPCR